MYCVSPIIMNLSRVRRRKLHTQGHMWPHVDSMFDKVTC